jgi:hypothetical protein
MKIDIALYIVAGMIGIAILLMCIVAYVLGDDGPECEFLLYKIYCFLVGALMGVFVTTLCGLLQ